MEKPKKLLIIGNGFDLHLELPSKFSDFIDTINVFNKNESPGQKIEDLIANIMDQEYDEENNNFFRTNPFIYCFNNNLDAYKFYKEISNSPSINDTKNNFWESYIWKLKSISESNKSQLSHLKNFLNLKTDNWSDVEYQIQHLLESSEKIIQCFNVVNELDVKDITSDPVEHIRTLNTYEHLFLNEENTMSESGIISCIALFESISCGWQPNKENIYDFWMGQLNKFENNFKKYLNTIKNEDYEDKANLFASKIIDSKNYALINFNYTYFYNNDSSKINIHSTLKDDGNPIFGISSLLSDGDNIFNKPYFKFSKSYRLMSIKNSVTNISILPEDIDQIVFYGHSLSPSDYMYFNAIFNYYQVEYSSVKLKFLFSKHSEASEKNMVQRVYKLLSKFSDDCNQPNLMQLLILQNKISIEEITD